MHKHEFGWTGIEVQVIRLGTWMIEGNQDIERRAVEAMRLGLDLGLTHIDTAEMYGDGHVEELVAEAIAVIVWYRTPGPSTYRCRGVDGCCCWLSVRRDEVLFKVFCSSGKSPAKVKQDFLVSLSFSRILLPLTSTPP